MAFIDWPGSILLTIKYFVSLSAIKTNAATRYMQGLSQRVTYSHFLSGTLCNIRYEAEPSNASLL